ncbi:hypothetical protein GCM10009654_45040 [Streptomyces hebeiensis]|uniref:Uncharacterized protein n=1 Tax=Streptomyces hebeiensis TaxID=229486 RepID=A0ABN1V270_9ACTN
MVFPVLSGPLNATDTGRGYVSLLYGLDIGFPSLVMRSVYAGKVPWTDLRRERKVGSGPGRGNWPGPECLSVSGRRQQALDGVCSSHSELCGVMFSERWPALPGQGPGCSPA